MSTALWEAQVSPVKEGIGDIWRKLDETGKFGDEAADKETSDNERAIQISQSTVHVEHLRSVVDRVPSKGRSLDQSDQESVQTELKELEKKLNDIARQQPFRGQPDVKREAHILKNLADALWYASCLRNPADSDKFERAVRFVVESYVQDDHILSVRDALFWRHPLWIISFPETLGKGLLMSEALRKIRESAFMSRAPGPRGNITKSAVMPPDKADLVRKIVGWYKDAPAETRSEIALTVGEWGGEAEALLLKKWLNEADGPNESLKRDIIAALANIGGPLAVNTLLEMAKTAPELTALAAIGSLEFLASGGSTSLTELPEPPIIDSLDQWKAYKNLSDRLVEFSNSEIGDEYVRYKAGELVDIIRPALRRRPAA